MSKILITGGAGFIGSHLAKELSEKHRVHVMDDLSHNGNLANLEGVKCCVSCADIAKLSMRDWMGLVKNFDVVFHQAAITDTTCKNLKLIWDVNFIATSRIIHACKCQMVPLIYASSASVFGKRSKIQKEDSPKHPDTLYARSKLSAEILHKQMKKSKSQICGLRYFNVYGQNEYYKGKMMSYLHQMVRQAKRGNQIALFKNGNQTRDFVHVDDVVRANILAWKSAKSGIFNIGSGIGTSFNQIKNELERQLNKKIDVMWVKNAHKHYQNHTCADISKARKAFRYSPKYDLKKGIEAIL